MRLPTPSEDLEAAYEDLTFEDFALLIGNAMTPSIVEMETIIESAMKEIPAVITKEQLTLLLQWSTALHIVLCKLAREKKNEEEQSNN